MTVKEHKKIVDKIIEESVETNKGLQQRIDELEQELDYARQKAANHEQLLEDYYASRRQIREMEEQSAKDWDRMKNLDRVIEQQQRILDRVTMNWRNEG